MTNWKNAVFYTGFTNDIERRAYEHRNGMLAGFTEKYKCKKLVYFEEFPDRESALHREKQIKRYKRDWKINLIRSLNPEWGDMYQDLIVNNEQSYTSSENKKSN